MTLTSSWRGRAAIAAVALGAGTAIAAGQAAKKTASADSAPAPSVIPYIESHTHFEDHDPEASVRAALAALGRQNAAKIYFLTLPETFDVPGYVDAEAMLPLARQHPDTLAVLGGGGSLNAMIQRAVASGDAGPAVQKAFSARAEELLRMGVVGFGEMSAEHFAGATPYQYAPADHPLFLLLADIAAGHGVPINIHMEAVPQAMALPAGLKSPPNPPQLHENIAAFERLLAHNRRARIVWAHGGSDGTGYRTPELSRRLLQAHPNLYQEIKVDPVSPGKNSQLADGRIKPEWLKLYQDFPERFLIGTDQHYPEPKDQPQRWQAAVLLLNQLPADVRKKIGMENAARLYSPKP